VRLNQQEVALVLVLRSLYDRALREGQVDDNGCVLASLENITISLRNLLKRSLPDNLTERKHLFKRLRQLRLIQMSQDDAMDEGDFWVRIRPMIMSYVSDDVLGALLEGTELPDTDLAAETAESEDNEPEAGDVDSDEERVTVTDTTASVFARD
jgi:hypothetical protein